METESSNGKEAMVTCSNVSGRCTLFLVGGEVMKLWKKAFFFVK